MTRKSKREIEREIDDLTPEPGEEYPQLDDVGFLFSYEWDFESPEENRLVTREEDGKVFHFPQEFEEAVVGAFSDDD